MRCCSKNILKAKHVRNTKRFLHLFYIFKSETSWKIRKMFLKIEEKNTFLNFKKSFFFDVFLICFVKIPLSLCVSLCVWPQWQEIGYNFLMISDETKKSSTCFLKYRSPITWYRQVQREIVWFQCENRLFHDYRNKTFDIFKNILFISKKRWNFDICDSLGGVRIF